MPGVDKTSLPTPDAYYLEENDKALISEALNLEVYQDTDDPNQYYYIPPFHVRQYADGAATMFLHVRQLEHYGDINQKLLKKDMASEKVIEELRMRVTEVEQAVQQMQQNYDKIEQDLKDAERRYEDAVAGGNERLIKAIENVIERHKTSLGKAETKIQDAELKVKDAELKVQDAETRLLETEERFINGESLIPEGLRKEIDQSIITSLNRAGFDIRYSDTLSADEMKVKIDEAIRLLESSYGGYLTVSVYAGFTANQLESLRTYLTKYFPYIKVSLMAMDSLSFESITELHNRDNTSGSKIYRAVQGSGDYLGSVITLDSTVAGSFAASQHLGPHVLPVKIIGVYKDVPPKTEIELDCKFDAGWEVYGRSDIKNGAVIFDDDITTKITADDSGSQACSFKLISGDRKSAEFLAMKELESHLESYGLSRIKLSQEEKQAYYTKIMEDIDAHRRPAGKYSSYYAIWTLTGWAGIAVSILSEASNFYWHTSEQNVSKFSSMSFKKKLSINGYDHITKAIPPDLCLVYNVDHSAYDRCSPVELKKAKTIQKASEEAEKSPECIGISSPLLCGEKRDQAGRTPNAPNRDAGNDAYLPQSI